MEINRGRNKTSSGDVIGTIDFHAQDGDNRVLAGQIQVVATAMADAGKAPVRYDFLAQNTAGTLQKVLTVDQNGFGYGTGVGNTATQTSSKNNPVTLNAISGQLTTHNASLASNTSVAFVLTNSFIAASDVLVINHVSGGTVGIYTFNVSPAAGSATITIRNISTQAEAAALVLNYVLLKGVSA